MKIGLLSLCMLIAGTISQNYNQNPEDFLSQAEQMPDGSYNDIMNMVNKVGSMEKNMSLPGTLGRASRSPGHSIQDRLDNARDPVSFMDALHVPQTHHHHRVHYPTTRLAKAVHLIHQKMEQRKRALRKRRFGSHPKRRRSAKDRVTQQMMNELLGRSAPKRKLTMGGMPGGVGIDPNALQDISTVMNGGKLLHSNPMPLENTSDLYGTLNQNSSLLGQRGIKELSSKMVNQFMPKVQHDVEKEMKKRFGNNYLVGHHRMHHHHYRQHHHHRPFHSNRSVVVTKRESPPPPPSPSPPLQTQQEACAEVAENHEKVFGTQEPPRV